MLSVYGKSVKALQIKEGFKVFRRKQGYVISSMPSYRVTRIYGNGVSLKYGQKRSIYSTILSIICRF